MKLTLKKEYGFMERYQIAYDELKNYIAKFLKSGEKEHYNSNTEYRKYWDALQNAIFESNNDRVTTVDISGMFLKSLASELSKNEIITADQKERLLERVKDKPDYSIESDELSSQDLYLWRAYSFALDDDICKFYFWYCKNQSYVKAEMISACLKKRDFVRAEFLTDMLIKTSQKDDFELDVKLYGSWALELTRVIKELVERFDRANSHNLSRDTITDEQVDNVVKIITDIIACLPQKMQDGMQRKLSILTPKKDSDEDVVASALNSVNTYVTNYKSRVRGAKEKTVESRTALRDSIVILSHLHRVDVLSTIFSQLALAKDKFTVIDRYSWWMFHLSKNLSGKELYDLFKMNNGIFDAWLDDLRNDSDISLVAHKIKREVSSAQFSSFKKFVVERKGENVLR